jgi:hypothetical protein
MERWLGDRQLVGSCLLEPPESLRYHSVTILRIGQSAGNPLGESPQRPYAARPNVESRAKRWSRPQRVRRGRGR